MSPETQILALFQATHGETLRAPQRRMKTKDKLSLSERNMKIVMGTFILSISSDHNFFHQYVFVMGDFENGRDL